MIQWSLNQIDWTSTVWFNSSQMSLKSFRVVFQWFYQWTFRFQSHREANFCISDFCRPFFWSPGDFFRYRARFQTEKETTCGMLWTTSSNVFSDFVSSWIAICWTYRNQSSAYDEYQQHAACWRIDMEVVGTDLVGPPPLLMDSQKFSCDVRDFTFGTGTPRVLRRIDASCHLAGSDQTKQLHWKVPWPSKGNGHSQYWIQVGGSAIDCESHANLVNSGARICSFKMLDVTMTIYDSWLFGSEFYHFLENLPYNCWHFFLEIGITTIN